MGPGLQEGPTSKIWEQCSYPGQDSYTIMGCQRRVQHDTTCQLGTCALTVGICCSITVSHPCIYQVATVTESRMVRPGRPLKEIRLPEFGACVSHSEVVEMRG